MKSFFKQYWIIILNVFLLVMISLPLLHFSNLLKIIDRQSAVIYPTTGQQPVIGVSFNNLLEERWLKEKAIMAEEAKSQGLSIQVKTANQSLERQIRQISDLIGQKVKVLIVNPVSNNGLAEVLTKARQAGIKTILYDELTNGPADLLVGNDYQTIGSMQITNLMKVSRGNYLVFRGPKNSYKAEMLYTGAQKAYLAVKNPALNTLAIETLTNWSAQEAVKKTRAMLGSQKITGILAPTDIIAEEIINYYQEQKLSLPMISGMGGGLSACQRILKGEQGFTIFINSRELAINAVTYAKNLIRNKKTPNLAAFNYSGQTIPAFFCPVTLVVKSNLKNILVTQMQIYTLQELITEP